MVGLAAVALGVLAFCLISGRLKDSIITPPMAFALFGLLVGAGGLDLVDAKIAKGAIHTLAEITLALILFTDAARVNLRLLIRDHDLPVRMLAIGMPLTIALGTIIAWILPLGLNLAEAALLAAVLAPTDAALGQAVISNRKVPIRIRQAINVESGLNDGIAVPFVYLFAAFLIMSQDAGSTSQIAIFAAKQLIFAPFVGAAIGGLAAWAAASAYQRGWLNDLFEGAFLLATVALAYALAISLDSNGFICVFVAGLVFGRVLDGRCKFILEFAEAEGQILILLAFLAFGAVMLPQLFADLTWTMLLYAILSLTVIRMIPIAVSLSGKNLSLPTIGFLGWFGPRGLASILFGLLVLEQLHSGGANVILITTIATIAISIIAHGISASVLAGWYAKMIKTQADRAEHRSVSEIPMRSDNRPKP
jgi:NhaP-type Na+/H+ or K+/H+ antiporter